MESTLTITGRVGTDMDSKVSRNGNKYVQFRLGTNRRVRNGDGQWEDAGTSWLSVRCYRQLGNNVAMSLRKGNPVVVVGRLSVDEWETDAGATGKTVYLDARAVGHDLNWGMTNYFRLEKERNEPASRRDESALGEDRYPEDDRDPYEDRPEGPDEHDPARDLAQAEALMASIGEPFGAH
ncbi:MAG: single-stranded DNA-binding protein [Propionibacteriaceae bacterium]|nr:single-stranded DNA-binding protein [Propionibacteriaceae bacterium]